MDLEELKALIVKANDEAKQAREDMSKEIKTAGEASAETKAALAEAEKKSGEAFDQIKKLNNKLIEMEKEQKRLTAGSYNEVKTLGSAFTAHDLFQKGADAILGKTIEIERKDISSGGASAGALVRPDRDPTVYMNPNRPTRIRDLIPSIPTSSNAVEVMRENVFTNNAEPQAGELATKAQSEIDYELITYPVRTMAHFVRASRQILSDAPQLQGLIDNRLPYGLDLLSDTQLLSGDGTGQNVTGLLVDTGVSNVGELPSGTAPTDKASAMIDHIRKGITQLQLQEYYNVGGIVLNPQNWEELETAKANDGHYLMISMPQDGSEPRIWRMPIVVTNAMPVDNFLLGDWNMGANLYERESISVRISEHDGTDFVQNAIKVLAEERYAFAIPLPKAFCKGQFTIAP